MLAPFEYLILILILLPEREYPGPDPEEGNEAKGECSV